MIYSYLINWNNKVGLTTVMSSGPIVAINKTGAKDPTWGDDRSNKETFTTFYRSKPSHDNR